LATLVPVRRADSRHHFCCDRLVSASSAQEETMNDDTMKGQWTQFKGRVREKWGKLTDDDLDQIQGKSEQLIGRLQERYGWAREDAQREVDTWMKGHSVTS
jgi:uncharacterized protein YjbJ (UPF0337 family)